MCSWGKSSVLSVCCPIQSWPATAQVNHFSRCSNIKMFYWDTGQLVISGYLTYYIISNLNPVFQTTHCKSRITVKLNVFLAMTCVSSSSEIANELVFFLKKRYLSVAIIWIYGILNHNFLFPSSTLISQQILFMSTSSNVRFVLDIVEGLVFMCE